MRAHAAAFMVAHAPYAPAAAVDAKNAHRPPQRALYHHHHHHAHAEHVRQRTVSASDGHGHHFPGPLDEAEGEAEGEEFARARRRTRSGFRSLGAVSEAEDEDKESLAKARRGDEDEEPGARHPDRPCGEPHAHTYPWLSALLPAVLAKRLAPPALPLYTQPQCPDHLQFNPYILTGYRAGYSLRHAYWSVAATHNETGNIWTHLAFVPVALAGAWAAPALMTLAAVPPHAAWSTSAALLALYLAGATSCLLASTLFHVHYCTTRRLYLAFGCADYAGISALIGSGALLLSHVALLGAPAPVRAAAFAACAPVALAGIIGPAFPVWHAARFRARRTGVYVAAAVLGACAPAAAVVADAWRGDANGGVAREWWARFGWAPLLATLVLGVVCYVGKVPEKWAPGRFDLWGHSHQIWHVCVIVGVTLHARYALAVLAWQARVLGGGGEAGDRGGQMAWQAQ